MFAWLDEHGMIDDAIYASEGQRVIADFKAEKIADKDD